MFITKGTNQGLNFLKEQLKDLEERKAHTQQELHHPQEQTKMR